MANLYRPLTGILGVAATGTVATATTGSKVWIVISAAITFVISSVTVVMSLIAKRYRQHK